MRSWFQSFSRFSGNRRKAQGRTRQGKQTCRTKFHRLGLEQFEQRVLLAADLAIDKTGTPTTVVPGELLTYNISVNNTAGATAATSTVMTDALPTGETYISATASQGTVNFAGGTVTADLGTLAAATGAATVSIEVMVGTNAPATLSNTASVSSPDDPASPKTSPAATTTVNTPTTAVDLSITKTALPTAGTVGTNEVYTITVKNNDTTNAAAGVVMTDALPANATFVSAKDTTSNTTLTPTGGVLTDDIGSLAAGATDTITVTVTPTTPGVVTNSATVTTTSGDPNPANNTATVSTNVSGSTGTAVDLSITKTAAPTTGTVGTNEVYTIVVTNNSTTTTATGVVMTDTLPANATFVSDSDGKGGTFTQAGNTLTDTIPSLAAGATDTISVTVTPTAVGTITNTANVEGAQPDNNQSNNTATVTTNINGSAGSAIDLSITKTAAPTTGTVGTNEVYTIVVTNNSATTTATGVVMSDFLPSNATFVSDSDGKGGAFTQAGNTLTDTIPSLVAGATDTITVTVRPTAVGVITNTANVEGAQPDNNQSNNTATVTTNVNGSVGTPVDLSITKTAAPTTGTVGANEVYTIVVTNNSTTTIATGVVMTDFLPANATFVSDSDGKGGTFSQTGNTLTDTIPSLAAGATDTITVTVTPTAAGTITNMANVEGNQTDNNQANNTASVTTTINPVSTAIDLSITKTAAPTVGTVGTNETYTIVVTNNDATNNATGVTMIDTLPANTTFVSANDGNSGATLTPTGGTLTDAIGNLAHGATDTITVVVTPTAAGTIINMAGVAGAQPDNNTANNTATVTTTINPASPSADLSITKIASPDPDTVGQNLTYTITVTNSGNIGANSTVVTDTLPAGLTVVSVSDNQNGTNSQSGNTVTDNLGTVAAGATATVTIVVTPSQAGSLTNTANVSTTSTNTGTNLTASVTSTVTGATPPPTGLTCFVAGQAGDNTDATFVRNLYRELLGREPDSAGQAAWLNFLAGNQGHSDSTRRASVISDFLDSPEYKQHLVTCIFELFLHRAPDAEGLQYWMGALGQPGNPGGNSEGNDEMSVISDIVGSPEYFVLHGNTNQGYVQGLYQDLLGRAADTGGEAYWAQQVARNGGDRSAVARSFVSTPEAEHKLLNADYPSAGNASDLTLSPAGSAQGGQYALADLTGGGWENLYFQGRGSANDEFFSKLQGQTPWDDVIEEILVSPAGYDASQKT